MNNPTADWCILVSFFFFFLLVWWTLVKHLIESWKKKRIRSTNPNKPWWLIPPFLSRAYVNFRFFFLSFSNGTSEHGRWLNRLYLCKISPLVLGLYSTSYADNKNMFLVRLVPLFFFFKYTLFLFILKRDILLQEFKKPFPGWRILRERIVESASASRRKECSGCMGNCGVRQNCWVVCFFVEIGRFCVVLPIDP